MGVALAGDAGGFLPFEGIAMSPLELRLALKERGFLPIPCAGKKPTLTDWQHTFEATPEEMQR